MASSAPKALSANGAIPDVLRASLRRRPGERSAAMSSQSIRKRSVDSCRSWQGVVGGRDPRPLRVRPAWPRSSTSSQASQSPPVLERDVLPARVHGYQPRLLDELGRHGRGRMGGPRAAWAATTAGSHCTAARASAARHCLPRTRRGVERAGQRAPRAHPWHLARRGACFYREIYNAAAGGGRPRGARRAVGPCLGRRGHQRHVRAAAGSALASGRARGHTTAARPPDSLGPPEAAGRWSLGGGGEGRDHRRGAGA